MHVYYTCEDGSEVMDENSCIENICKPFGDCPSEFQKRDPFSKCGCKCFNKCEAGFIRNAENCDCVKE